MGTERFDGHRARRNPSTARQHRTGARAPRVRGPLGSLAAVLLAGSIAVLPSAAPALAVPAAPRARVCFDVAGAPGDVAVVNLTPVEASGSGYGLLVSSDLANPPVASNVNFTPGSVDPNVAFARIGADGQVCYVNSELSTVHLIADHLGTINAAAYRLAQPNGAPKRAVDTRTGAALPAAGRVCFAVSGAPGDVAVVNLTPVEASGSGYGLLVSSDVANPPVVSNVNFTPGSVDPNVAFARIGADGQVCYVNSELSTVHLIADHLGTIAFAAYRLAQPNGAPKRVVDTRGGAALPAAGRVCFAVSGAPGDVAVVNLTPVEASGSGYGLLVSSDVANPPVVSNVNFAGGTVDPNVAAATVGADGRVCFVNSELSSVHLVADHLGTIAAAAYTPARSDATPKRAVDTRSCTSPACDPTGVWPFGDWWKVPQLGPEPAAGSGCGWGSNYGGQLPDGWWYGYVDSFNPSSRVAQIGLLCGLYGAAAEQAVAECEAENVGEEWFCTLYFEPGPGMYPSGSPNGGPYPVRVAPNVIHRGQPDAGCDAESATQVDQFDFPEWFKIRGGEVVVEYHICPFG